MIVIGTYRKDLTMQRIDERTVELTAREQQVKERFDELLDRGMGIPKAAALALNQGVQSAGLFPSREFVDYLSEGTCKRWGGRILVKREWRSKD